MHESDWRFRCDKRLTRDAIELYIFRYRKDKPRIEIVEDFKTIRMEEDAIAPPTTLFSMLGSQAQELMDDLWRCGVRPTEGAGTAGSMAATQRHLEDMRELVFHRTGGKKP